MYSWSQLRLIMLIVVKYSTTLVPVWCFDGPRTNTLQAFHAHNFALFCCLGWVSSRLNLAVWKGTSLGHLHTVGCFVFGLFFFPLSISKDALYSFLWQKKEYVLGFLVCLLFFFLSWPKLDRWILPLSSSSLWCNSQLHFHNSVVLFIPSTSYLWIWKRSGD